MIYEIRDDITRFAGVASYVINPTNLVGVMGAGLAKTFASIYPDMADRYKFYCQSKMLRQGQVYRYQISDHAAIINLPTKTHFKYESDVELIRAGLVAFRTKILCHRPLASVALPLLGAGLGKLTEEESRSLIHEVFKDLKTPVLIVDFKCPSRKIHGVVGTRTFSDLDKIRDVVSLGISTIHMDTGLGDMDAYDGFVSGGAKGVDAAAPHLAKIFNKSYLEIPAEWDTFGKRSGHIRNELVALLSTSATAIVNADSKGTWGTIAHFDRLGIPYRLECMPTPLTWQERRALPRTQKQLLALSPR